MGLLESPIPRNIPQMILYMVIKGTPAKHMMRYFLVPSTASAGVDIACTIGSTQIRRTIVNRQATARNSRIVFPTARFFNSLSPLPTALPIRTVDPVARPTIITVTICMTWLPIDTAVVLDVGSNCPMIKRSASPYSVCSTYDIKKGSENTIMFLRTLPSVRFFSIFLYTR